MSHFTDFAVHLIEQRGPQTTATIHAAFRNAGNDLEQQGRPFDDDHELQGDKRLTVENGHWVLRKPEGDADAAPAGQ